MAKLNTKMGISMKTMTDKSTRNLAEMLSEGTSQGVMDCIKSQKIIPTQPRAASAWHSGCKPSRRITASSWNSSSEKTAAAGQEL